MYFYRENSFITRPVEKTFRQNTIFCYLMKGYNGPPQKFNTLCICNFDFTLLWFRKYTDYNWVLKRSVTTSFRVLFLDMSFTPQVERGKSFFFFNFLSYLPPAFKRGTDLSVMISRFSAWVQHAAVLVAALVRSPTSMQSSRQTSYFVEAH